MQYAYQMTPARLEVVSKRISDKGFQGWVGVRMASIPLTSKPLSPHAPRLPRQGCLTCAEPRTSHHIAWNVKATQHKLHPVSTQAACSGRQCIVPALTLGLSISSARRVLSHHMDAAGCRCQGAPGALAAAAASRRCVALPALHRWWLTARTFRGTCSPLLVRHLDFLTKVPAVLLLTPGHLHKCCTLLLENKTSCWLRLLLLL